MQLDQFLVWDDGTDTRYELIDGVVIPMPLLPVAASMLKTRLAIRIHAALANRRPARAEISPGIIPLDRRETFFVADVGATSAPMEPKRQNSKDPFLLAEILASSTEEHDRLIKLPAYRQLATVQEILFIASDGIYAELHRRSAAQWITEILRGPDAILVLLSVPVEIRLGELYDGIALPESEG